MSQGPTGDDVTDGDQTIESLIESDRIPHSDSEPVFDAPWQARAFGLAVALDRIHGMYEWRDFQERLTREIARGGSESRTEAPLTDIENTYYERWITALERLLIEEGHMTPEEFEQRTAEFEAGDRTAAEFVEGEHDH